MNKVITLAMMLVFALLASAEPVKITLQKGDQGRKLYYSHSECQVNLSCDEFLAEAAPMNGFENTDENWRKIRAGQEFILPVDKNVEPQPATETKENVNDATDGGNDNGSANDERTDSGTPGPELAIGDDKFDLSRDGYRIGPERDSLETVSASPEEGRSPEQPATAQPTDLAASESALIIADLTRKNEELTIREKETEAEIVKIKQESVSALQIAGAAVKIRDEKIARLERELADKSKTEAIALGNNGSYLNNSSDSFIWILAVAAIAAAGIILILIPCVIYLYRQASQLPQKESDRLMLEKEIDKLKSTFEQRLANQTKFLQEELNKSEREVKKGKRNLEFLKDLAKRNFFFFEYPGIVRKANKQPVDYIVLRIYDRHNNGAVKRVIVPGIEEPVEVREPFLESALRSDAYIKEDDAFLLPPKLELIPKETEEDVEFMPTLYNLPDKVEAPVANAS